MDKRLKELTLDVALLPVQFYRYVISPLTPASCRHIPTCSEYSIEAVKRYGLIKGGAMAAERISRCHPWGTAGYDPVPLFTFRVFIRSKQKSSLLKPRK
jgi:putative membrane protein insertion efficiency factor